jgi:hypothetical protein|tara:strand:+ start:3246 stop:3530 length:285 start_codon:yes stop_codon:yes gene_type:complete
MSRDKETEQWKYFSKLMDDYKSGKRGVQPGHPKEIEDAIKTFLDAANMIREFPEIDSIPPEYVENLFNVLTKYPEYNRLTLELVDILNKGQNNA